MAVRAFTFGLRLRLGKKGVDIIIPYAAYSLYCKRLSSPKGKPTTVLSRRLTVIKIGNT